MITRNRTWGRRSAIIAASAAVLSAAALRGETTPVFTAYQSTDRALPVRFEYPEGWEAEASAGSVEAYAQVQVYAPASFEPRVRSYLVVRALPLKEAGGRYGSVQEMADAYEQSLMPSLRIEARREVPVLGATGRVLGVSGTMRLPWKSANAKMIPVKGQRVFVQADGRLYELAWLTTPEKSADVEQAFAHLLKTLTVLP